MHLKQIIKPFIPQPLLSLRQHLRDIRQLRPLTQRNCPVCGCEGKFEIWFGPTLIRDNTCPKCRSHPRHRLFWLWYRGDKEKLVEPILHFAPEAVLSKRFQEMYMGYKTADLFNPADLKLDIENIDLETGSYNTVICNHVLEHVDDYKALREIYRILSDSGRLICSVPLIEGWEKTYENDTVVTELERELHFDQNDHIRYYGRDFRDRLRAAGFCGIEEITAEGEDVVQYGLQRGEKFFICSKAELVPENRTVG